MNKWITGLLFLFTSNAFSQPMITKVIDLHYCKANKILELIQPLLQPDEKVSGSGQTLVVNVSPETLTQIRVVLQKVDQPPVTLHVTIHQGPPDWLTSRDQDVITYSAKSEDTLQQNQSVNVLSGAAAFVSTGQEVPILTAAGEMWGPGISYAQHNTSNGMEVSPTLEGSQVKLKVKRIREQLNQQQFQQFDNQQIDTTMMIPLNKWVSLGSTEGAAASSSNTVTYGAGNKFSRTATIYIKVSVLNPDNAGLADAN